MARDAQPAYPFVLFEDRAIDQSIASRFEQQAARYPDRLAVASADRTIHLRGAQSGSPIASPAPSCRVWEKVQSRSASSWIMARSRLPRCWGFSRPGNSTWRWTYLTLCREWSRCSRIPRPSCFSPPRSTSPWPGSWPEERGQQVLNCDDLDDNLPGRKPRAVHRSRSPRAHALHLRDHGASQGGGPQSSEHSRRSQELHELRAALSGGPIDPLALLQLHQLRPQSVCRPAERRRFVRLRSRQRGIPGAGGLDAHSPDHRHPHAARRPFARSATRSSRTPYFRRCASCDSAESRSIETTYDNINAASPPRAC